MQEGLQQTHISHRCVCLAGDLPNAGQAPPGVVIANLYRDRDVIIKISAHLHAAGQVLHDVLHPLLLLLLIQAQDELLHRFAGALALVWVVLWAATHTLQHI